MGQWVGAQGRPKVAYFSKTCLLCDVSFRKHPTETENCFFRFWLQTCWIRGGFEQLSTRDLCSKSAKLTARYKLIFLLPVKFFRNASAFVYVCFLKALSSLSLHHVRQTAVSNLCSRTSFRLSQHEKCFAVYLGNEISLTVYLSVTDSFFLWGSQRKRLIYVDAIFVSVVAPMLYTLSLLTRFIPKKTMAVT